MIQDNRPREHAAAQADLMDESRSWLNVARARAGRARIRVTV